MKDHQTTNQSQQLLPPSPIPVYPVEDEIDLMGLVLKVWRTRVVWVISMAIVSLLFWGWWSIKQMNSLTPLTYHLPIQLNFEGIDRGSYPNGSPFSRSELLAPNVIQSVFEQNNLDQYGISLSEFSTQVRVTPYAIEILLIQEKYRQILDNKGLAYQDIDIILDKQKEEVRLAYLGGRYMLSFTPSNSNVPDNIINNTLFDIPKIWSQKAINHRGVLNIKLVTAIGIIDEEIIESLDYMVAVDYLTLKMKKFQESIVALLNSPNGFTTHDSETGITLQTLHSKLIDAKTYMLDPLTAPILELGISKTPEITLHHYQNLENNLQARQKNLLEKSVMLTKIHRNYTQSEEKEGQSTGSHENAEQPQARYDISPQMGNITPNLGVDFLDRIMEISEKATDASFRQGLISTYIHEKKVYELEAIEVGTKIDKIKINILSLTNEQYDKELKLFWSLKIEEGIPQIIDRLNYISGILERIIFKIALQNHGNSDSLYNVMGDSYSSGGIITLLAKQEKQFYLLLLLVTTFVVIPVAMIINSLRNKDNENSVD